MKKPIMIGTVISEILLVETVENGDTLQQFVGPRRWLGRDLHARRSRSDRRPPQSTRYVAGTEDTTMDMGVEDERSDMEHLPLHVIRRTATPPYQVPLILNNGISYQMELHTGTSVTLMSETECNKLFPRAPLKKSSMLLRTYSGECLPVIGEMEVRVQYRPQDHNLVLTVVAGSGPSLLGRNWLQNIQLNWREIRAVSIHQKGTLDYLLDKHGDLFHEKLGAKLQVTPKGPSRFYKFRTVPYNAPLRKSLNV